MKTRTPNRTTARSADGTTARRSKSALSTSTRKSGGRKAAAGKSTRAASSGKSKSGAATTTTDHDEIQQWVESHGGHPATVKSTTKKGQAAGLLRIDFPGFSGEQSLKPVSWDEWFEIFDQRKLAFLYQEKAESRFNKLVNRKK